MTWEGRPVDVYSVDSSTTGAPLPDTSMGLLPLYSHLHQGYILDRPCHRWLDQGRPSIRSGCQEFRPDHSGRACAGLIADHHQPDRQGFRQPAIIQPSPLPQKIKRMQSAFPDCILFVFHKKSFLSCPLCSFECSVLCCKFFFLRTRTFRSCKSPRYPAGFRRLSASRRSYPSG